MHFPLVSRRARRLFWSLAGLTAFLWVAGTGIVLSPLPDPYGFVLIAAGATFTICLTNIILRLIAREQADAAMADAWLKVRDADKDWLLSCVARLSQRAAMETTHPYAQLRELRRYQ